MPGPRKVRVFKDERRSPNWYVEWRDAQGNRHCESCGPHRHDADERSRQIKAELRRLRQKGREPLTQTSLPSASADSTVSSPALLAKTDTPQLAIRAIVRCVQVEFPIELFIEVPPDLLRTIRQLIADATQPSAQ
jgi:hypothetical protein